MVQAKAYRAGVIIERLSFPEGGLHQCRSEKNGQGVPANGQPVPSLVPSRFTLPAKAAPLRLEAMRVP